MAVTETGRRDERRFGSPPRTDFVGILTNARIYDVVVFALMVFGALSAIFWWTAAG